MSLNRRMNYIENFLELDEIKRKVVLFDNAEEYDKLSSKKKENIIAIIDDIKNTDN